MFQKREFKKRENKTKPNQTKQNTIRNQTPSSNSWHSHPYTYINRSRVRRYSDKIYIFKIKKINKLRIRNRKTKKKEQENIYKMNCLKYSTI